MKKKKWVSKVFLGILGIYLLLPFVVTLIYSLFTEWVTILPSGFTLQNYQTLIGDSTFWLSMGRTIIICILSVCISVSILLLAMYAVIENPKLGAGVQFSCMIPYALQGVILSISIISLYSGTGTMLSNRMLMLFGAYSILVLPYIYQGIKNNLNAINAQMLMQAAQMLGCSRLGAYIKIVIPNMMSGIMVSALLAVSIIFGDFVLANNIAGNNYQNIQVYLFTKLSVSSGYSSAIVVFIFLLILLITGSILFLQENGKRKEKEV